MGKWAPSFAEWALIRYNWQLLVCSQVPNGRGTRGYSSGSCVISVEFGGGLLSWNLIDARRCSRWRRRREVLGGFLDRALKKRSARGVRHWLKS